MPIIDGENLDTSEGKDVMKSCYWDHNNLMERDPPTLSPKLASVMQIKPINTLWPSNAHPQ